MFIDFFTIFSLAPSLSEESLITELPKGRRKHPANYLFLVQKPSCETDELCLYLLVAQGLAILLKKEMECAVVPFFS